MVDPDNVGQTVNDEPSPQLLQGARRALATVLGCVPTDGVTSSVASREDLAALGLVAVAVAADADVTLADATDPDAWRQQPRLLERICSLLDGPCRVT